MTLRLRLRLSAAWYLLAVVDWLLPPVHTYVTSGGSFTRIDSLTRCTRCWAPYVDRHDERCQSRRQREIGTRPRLRKHRQRAENYEATAGTVEPDAPRLRVVK